MLRIKNELKTQYSLIQYMNQILKFNEQIQYGKILIIQQMGKHKKVVNNDPILKKDYKYEKRKLQRALQKQEQKQRLEKQFKAKQQIAQIQNEVQEQIQRQLLKHSIIQKQKKISKIPKQLFSKKVPTKPSQHKQTILNKQILNIPSVEQDKQPDHYANHFAQLPKRIQIVRQHQQSKKDKIDREVKQQIKDMFSIKAQNQNNTHKMDQQQNHIQKKQIRAEEQYSNPYILIKSQQSKQKQLLINNQQVNYFTPEAYETKNTLIQCQNGKDFRKTVINSYKDYIHIQNKQQNTIEQFRRIVISHMINHQNRCRQQPNNSKGFTNAKSLILCPFFGDAKSIIQILSSYYQQYEEVNKQKLDQVQDENDFFRIGIHINDKKKIIKYFSHFNVSNFIIGSPVGLKAIVGTEGQTQRDYSFLSSVEIMYIDRASVIYMQNWDHLVEVVKSMNMMPNSDSICNPIDTFRTTVPEIKGKLYRQSIIFSQFNFPQINGLKFSQFHNWQGCITSKVFYPPRPDTKRQQFDIQFYKMELIQPRDDLQVRFDFFKRKFWDEIHNTDSMKKTVIFTRSYFQFIKMKEFLIRVNASADFISEYTKKPKVQSKISFFNANKYRILLITQRAYYFGVCQIKKLQHLYFYSLPRNSYIYSQLISQIMKQYNYTKNKVLAIYTKYDIMPLERIVGTKKAIEMVKQYCSNVSFMI